MTLTPTKVLSVSFAEKFLYEIESSIMQPINLIGLEWIERIEDENSGWSNAFEIEKVVMFINRP